MPPVFIRLAATFAAFLLAVYGIGVAYVMNRGVAGPLSANAFKALQLVVGVFPNDLDGKPLPWSLQLARWALPLLTLWTLWETTWAQARNPVRLRWIRRRGEHLVIAGDAALAASAIAAERRNGAPVLLWIEDASEPWVARAADLGAPHIISDGPAEGADALGLDRARAVLLLGEDDAHNVALAVRAGAAAQAGRPPGDPLPVLVRIEDPDLRDSVEQRFARAADRRTARPRLISVADILARQLFVEHPLDGFVRAGQGARILFVLGFTPLAERYLLRLLAGGHFRDGVRPRIIVLDPAADRCERVFRARRPRADALARLIFETAPVDEAALLAGVVEEAIDRHGAPVALLIDAPGDGKALALAEAADAAFARRALASPPIHVHMSRCPEGQTGTMVRAFGEAASLAEPERLLQERHDALARSIHDFYLEGQLDEGRIVGDHGSLAEWDDLSERVRDDNRLVADCYRLKLRDVGARLGPGDRSLKLARDEVEQLARAEHDRWMAAKHVDGWVHGETRDDAARRHPDLVPYDDLTERVKDLDREQVRLISRLLPLVGISVRRMLVVEIPPGTTAVGAAAAMPAVLAGLAQHYPDRSPMMRGWLGDAAVRAALAAGRDGGVGVQPVTTGNVDTLIDLLPHDEANVARTLVRDADTLFVVNDAASADANGQLPPPDLILAGADAPDGAIPVIRVSTTGAIVSAPWRA